MCLGLDCSGWISLCEGRERVQCFPSVFPVSEYLKVGDISVNVL